MNAFDVPTLLVLTLWGALAAAVIMRLRRHGRAAFDARLTGDDRKLIGSTAFYLLVPLAVLVSQLLKLGFIRAIGGHLGHFETWVYWSNLEPAETLPAAARATSASVAPGFLVLLALTLGGWTWVRPSRAAVNLLRLELTRALAVLALGIQPVVSILARRGDHHVLHEALNELHRGWGDAALLGYALVAATLFWVWRRGQRLRALASPLHDATRAASSKLDRNPDDPDALRVLGAAQLAWGHPDAITTLERASKLASGDPRIALLIGQAYLRSGDPASAAHHLREAGQRYEAHDADDDALFFEIALTLSAARLALGDAEGARITAEVARESVPSDPRGLLMHVDALVAVGDRASAEEHLMGARNTASGPFRREIERRIDALRRRAR